MLPPPSEWHFSLNALVMFLHSEQTASVLKGRKVQLPVGHESFGLKELLFWPEAPENIPSNIAATISVGGRRTWLFGTGPELTPGAISTYVE